MRVHDGPLEALDRLGLIALMLGRDMADATRVTSFREEGERDEQPVVLAAHGLTRHQIIDDVDVTVRRGEVVGLAGLLGSGRSSTAKAIFGAESLDAGSVSMDGSEVRKGSTRAAIAAGIALIPEDRKAEGVVPTLSVQENISLTILPRLARRGLLISTDERRIAEGFIDRLRIKTSGPDQRLSELSGGNQQKVLLARMLASAPRLLILDDPTRGIDVGAKSEIQTLVSELAGGGLAVILISSDLEEVVEGSDRLVVMRDGVVIGELSGDDVHEDRVVELLAEASAAPGANPGSTR
jgi:ribose transport system ATP-binding protein